MANTATRSILRTRVRQLADMVSSTFVTDDEINTWLDVGLSELHDILANHFEDYFESSCLVPLVSGTSDYPLASPFYKMLSIDHVVSGKNYRIARFMNRERNRRQSNTPWLPASEYQYRVIGSCIRFIPTPTASGLVQYKYVPQYTKLAADNTLVDSAVPQGWEELAVLEAAIRCMHKEESDPSLLIDRKDRLLRRIMESADSRDANEPLHVVDVYNRFGSESYWEDE